MNNISYRDRTDNIGPVKVTEREILNMPDELEAYSNGAIAPFSDKKKEKLESCYYALRELTNGRYPSFFTVSHVVSGAHKEAPISSSKYYIRPDDLRGEGLKEFIEGDIDKDGFVVSTVYNPYHSNKNHSTIGHPLFVFGKNNPRFIDFVNQKYRHLLTTTSLPQEIIVDQDKGIDGKKNKLKATYKDGFLFKTVKEAKPYGSLETLLFNDEDIPFLVSTGAAQYLYEILGADSSDPAKKIQIDLPVAYDQPVFGRDDGDLITPNDTPLKWNYAEMMIDIYGLDGKKKITFFE